MSLLSQFFPSGGGGSSNIGGGTVPVEILGISGGGGGGAGHRCSAPYSVRAFCGGCGGTGAVFYANNYYLEPGVTYPITIGAGGAGGVAPVANGTGNQAGAIGGSTCFNNPNCFIFVQGGGSGDGNRECACTPDPHPNPALLCGVSGGTGGGPSLSSPQGLYFKKLRTMLAQTCVAAPFVYSGFSVSEYENLPMPWGEMAGYPGTPGSNIQSPYIGPSGAYRPLAGTCSGFGGNASGGWFPGAFSPYIRCGSDCYQSNITGSIVGYGQTIGKAGGGGGQGAFPYACRFLPGTPPTLGCIACAGCSGCAGAVIIRWQTPHGAAPPTGFPGGTNISPQTPGYNAYCFTSSGSITLP